MSNETIALVSMGVLNFFGVPALLKWLLQRAVDGLDKQLKAMNGKLDDLQAEAKETAVELGQLKVRVIHLEEWRRELRQDN